MSLNQRCGVCGRDVQALRRGLCAVCEGRLRSVLAIGDACELCGIADSRVLRPARLGSAVICLCRNDASIAEGASPRPRSIGELRALLTPPGDRRAGLDRRTGDRRGDPRRGADGDRRAGLRHPDKGDRRFRDRRASA